MTDKPHLPEGSIDIASVLPDAINAYFADAAAASHEDGFIVLLDVSTGSLYRITVKDAYIEVIS